MKKIKSTTKVIAVDLNTKECALLRELHRKAWNGTKWTAVPQSELFCAFERKNTGVKAKNHERAGWAVRNSARKLIASKLVVRVERGTLKLTTKGLAFVESMPRAKAVR